MRSLIRLFIITAHTRDRFESTINGNRCSSSGSESDTSLVIRPATLTDVKFTLVTEPSLHLNNFVNSNENIDLLQNEVAPIHVTESIPLTASSTENISKPQKKETGGIALRSGGESNAVSICYQLHCPCSLQRSMLSRITELCARRTRNGNRKQIISGTM